MLSRYRVSYPSEWALPPACYDNCSYYPFFDNLSFIPLVKRECDYILHMSDIIHTYILQTSDIKHSANLQIWETVYKYVQYINSEKYGSWYQSKSNQFGIMLAKNFVLTLNLFLFVSGVAGDTSK